MNFEVYEVLLNVFVLQVFESVKWFSLLVDAIIWNVLTMISMFNVMLRESLLFL